MEKEKGLLYFFSLYTLLLLFSCKKPPFNPGFKNIGGLVIGREFCASDVTQEYWLLDFTVYPNSPQIGDTLTIGGTSFSNVLKLKGLDPFFKQIGKKVSIDYKTITPNQVISNTCSNPSPTTYLLKELFIINQGEIR